MGIVSTAREPHSGIAVWSVALSIIAAVLVTIGLTGSGMAGMGMVAATVSFGLALTAYFKRERWRMLWLPLLLFPVLAVSLPLWV